MRTLRVLFALLSILGFAVPAFARGDKVIPQVADGPGYRTKFWLLNTSESLWLSKHKIKFFRQNGTAWVLATSLGTGSEFPLNIGPRVTWRVETLGNSPQVTSGYAVIIDEETATSAISTDFHLEVTAFYEVRGAGNAVVDTVSVPVGQPTLSWAHPIENDAVQDKFTGFALVNLAGGPAEVRMFLWGKGPSEQPLGQATLTLAPGQQIAEFYIQRLFPGRDRETFFGTVTGISFGPVAMVALLQTRGIAGSLQYAVMKPAYRDALRPNNLIHVPQPLVTSMLKEQPVDLDQMNADYFRSAGDDDAAAWDLVYETVSKTERQLRPAQGSGVLIAPLGVKDDKGFDEVHLAQIKSLTYRGDPVSFNEGSPNLTVGTAFAVRTALGQFAKIRLASVVTSEFEGVTYRSLVLEVFLFR